MKWISLSALVIAGVLLASPGNAEDNDVTTEDLTAWLGADAAKHDAAVCRMTVDGSTSSYVLVQAKGHGAREAGLRAASVWRLDSDGSHGYFGCDGGIDAEGRFRIGEWTTGVWMTPHCVCAFERMRAEFAPEPLETTTGKALFQRAQKQDCGAINTETYRLRGKCSDEAPPLPE